MNSITKIFIALVLGVVFVLGAFPDIAHADEVEIIPDVSVSIDYEYNGTTKTLPLSVRNQNVNTYWVNSSSFRPSDFIAYNSSSYNYSWDDPSNHAVTLRHTSWATDATDGFLSFDNLVFTLDMSDVINGYYRFESDVYLGLGFNYGGSSNYDFSPSFTVSSAPVNVPDSENGMHLTAIIVGSNEISITNRYYTSKTITTDLVHIYIYSTFYYDSTYGTTITFDASPVFNSLGVLTYDFSVVRSGGNYTFENFANNRFSYKLFSNVEPPVTPTPTVTPYPGQDTQESINQGVQTIIQGLDVQATPIPHPDDLTIDETIFDALDDMTLPDVTPAQSTFTNLWSIFNPLWAFVGLFAGSMSLVGIFMYCLKGRFI